MPSGAKTKEESYRLCLWLLKLIAMTSRLDGVDRKGEKKGLGETKGVENTENNYNCNINSKKRGKLIFAPCPGGSYCLANHRDITKTYS